MTDKSAPTPPTTASSTKPQAGPKQAGPKQAVPKQAVPKQAGPKRTSAPRPAEADTSVGDTAVRPGFAERLQAKLAAGAAGLRSSADETSTAPAPAAAAKPRGPRRARLRLTRIDPWSVMKTSFLLSIAFGIVTVVAVAMIWNVLDGAGVFDSVNQTVRDVVDDQATATFDVRDYIGTDRVVGFTMLVAAVDVVLLTAIATLGAFLYNMAAALLGGVEVTLAEDN
ncbi:DUF3566 domain-containing protein [Nocardioides sp.]|uniref:DUF3566 domain-containing protein n=1 Tax=Nocardioides sp. TaxID=35761 RepID=UPI002B276E02|nr:DUF3566 domain-containing protein [Nocardioides sp.]